MDIHYQQNNEREVEEFLEKLENNLESQPAVLIFTNPLFHNNGDVKQEPSKVNDQFFTDVTARPSDLIETIIEEEEEENEEGKESDDDDFEEKNSDDDDDEEEEDEEEDSSEDENDNGEINYNEKSCAPISESVKLGGDSVSSNVCNPILNGVSSFDNKGYQVICENVLKNEENRAKCEKEYEKINSVDNEKMNKSLTISASLNDLREKSLSANTFCLREDIPSPVNNSLNAGKLRKVSPVENLSDIVREKKTDFENVSNSALPNITNCETSSIIENIVMKQATIEVVEEEQAQDFFTVEDMVGKFNLKDISILRGPDLDVNKSEIRLNLIDRLQHETVDSVGDLNPINDIENDLSKINKQQSLNDFEKNILENVEFTGDVNKATRVDSNINVNDDNDTRKSSRRNSIQLDNIISEDNKVENIIRRNSLRRNSISGEDIENALEVLKNSVETASAALSEKRNSVSLDTAEKPILDRGELEMNETRFLTGEGKRFGDEEDDIGEESEYFSATTENYMDDDRDSFIEASDNFLDHRDTVISDKNIEGDRSYSLHFTSRPLLRRYDSLPDYKRDSGFEYRTFPYKSGRKNKKETWEYPYDSPNNFKDTFRDDYSRDYSEPKPVLSRSWRSCYSLKTNGLSPEWEELQEKIHKLEGERDSLTLQVSVLTEQVDAQSEKIRDLEVSLEEKKERLDTTEEMLQHELLTRSSLETQKLDLLKELSNLKLQLAAAERERLELQSKNHAVQLELSVLQHKLNDREQEVNYLRSKFNKIPDQEQEIESLKRALGSLMAVNEEKDQKIEELCATISRYKRVQDMVVSAKLRRSDSITSNDDVDNLSFDNISEHNANGILEPVRASSKERSLRFQEDPRIAEKPPPVPRHNSVSSPGGPFTPVHDNRYPPIPVRSLPGIPGPRKPPIGARSSSCEEIPNDLPPLPPLPPKAKFASAILFHQTPPANRQHQLNQYASSPSVEHPINPEPVRKDAMENFRPRPKGHGLSFGKGLFKSLRTNKRCTSAPNLAQSEILEREDSPRQPSPGVSSDPRYSPDSKKKPKGIKKLFGRLIRSNSQSLHPESQETDMGDFKRGGFRATAGPRLGWSRELRGQDILDIPFARWDSDKVAAWLHELGLTAYVADCKRWLKNGQQLLQASAHDLEKELSIRHPLHKKKLQLALQAMGSEENDVMGQLDYHWVTRWLDDIGLPLYKDQFNEARVDGRMLHYLTLEDLFFLKVTNSLHHISLKRGIQILRENNFNPNCFKRRPMPEEISVTLRNIPSEVVLWTNHRVMEWLRTVDLSEYAANLRGSGVHGALLILEPRFDAEVLATLLSIPSSKTLLRRHLNTHFTTLVGNEVIQKKREAQADPNYVPISHSAKIKPLRKGFSLMRKHSKNELHYDEYLCPMDIQSPLLLTTTEQNEESPQRRDSHGSVNSRSGEQETMLTDDKTFAEMTSSTV